MQNKLHYAAHGHTAAEVIEARADVGKPFMDLLSFSGRSCIAASWAASCGDMT
ncbi:MAG: virulence RhuM family protein [Propionibacteriaceae bacterium]|nr:virulence RhuM family protein [Propionibacteriaceae bacterium]